MKPNFAMLTDFYELTMMQGYFLYDHNPNTVFEMTFRRQPFDGGFTIFAGLESLLKGIQEIKFSGEDLEYLASQKIFHDDFLDYLANFCFSGDIYAMDEGSLAFPFEPLIRVHAPLIEAQLLESFLLNIINFQTLVATKAARVYLASGEGLVLEFGLRRAHGSNGAISASRAAFIGGAAATSNTLAGKLYGIPIKGTMAHSWIMSFETELESFQKYAEIYPEGCILLIDTYDTLTCGLDNAVQVGKKLREQGHRGFGVRLDSGDLEYLSKQVRTRLDQEGLQHTLISASNDLDESIIHQLVNRGAPIDIWGVGTNLVTAKGDPSLTGVYKLAAKEIRGSIVPTIKVSNNPEKTTNPGIKQVYRFYNSNGHSIADLMALEDEGIEPDRPYRFYHPKFPYRHQDIKEYERIAALLSLKMKQGQIVNELPGLREIQENTKRNLSSLDETYKRIINPHVYKVSLTEKLKDMKFDMIEAFELEREV
ncbi:MAG: nicotinate phosphoribosyltransferase [Spirochaetota bacterium]|nr:nicotinate phosphoribosyltransferase [Spirochaetota bacterium]